MTTPTTPATHDLRCRSRGHSVEFLPPRHPDGSWWACIFVSAQIRPGDYVLHAGQVAGQPATLRYRVVGDVDRPLGPGGYHFVTLIFDPEEAPATVEAAPVASTEAGAR